MINLQKSPIMKTPYISELRVLAPTIAFIVSRDVDPNYVWDGDGPNPLEEGFYPHDVTVTAKAIIYGHLLEGSAYIGGSYYQEGEPIGDVHGYLLQMLEEAADELSKQLPPEFKAVRDECEAAKWWLNREMEREYEKQMNAA